jgi:hypothetical protein
LKRIAGVARRNLFCGLSNTKATACSISQHRLRPSAILASLEGDRRMSRTAAIAVNIAISSFLAKKGENVKLLIYK